MSVSSVARRQNPGTTIHDGEAGRSVRIMSGPASDKQAADWRERQTWGRDRQPEKELKQNGVTDGN